MKKFLQIISVFVFLLFFVVSANAQVTKEDFNASGIYIDQPVSEVVAIYGFPREIEPAAGKGYFYKYGQYDTIFNVHSYDRNLVSGFVSEGNNGSVTKSGIRYGSSLENVLNIYGKPNIGKYDHNGNYVIEYEYYNNKFNVWVLRFKFKNNWVIGFSFNSYY